jgi:hypothetical protein
MKVESRTILGAFLFLAAIAGLYWGLVEIHGHAAERAGIAMLVFSFAAYALLGFYLLAQYFRRRRIPRPEDRFDATPEDGAGVVDYFPAASIWPAGLGAGMFTAALGGIWGIWYAYIGGIVAVGAIIGWVTESDRSEDVLPGADPAEILAGHEVPSEATMPHFHAGHSADQPASAGTPGHTS